MVILPTSQTYPHYSMSVVLDDVNYRFTFRWNTRAEVWYMTVADNDGVVLASGVKVVLGIPLLARRSLAGLPTGMLVAVDTTGRDVPARINDLGTRVLLVYVPADEAREIAEAA